MRQKKVFKLGPIEKAVPLPVHKYKKPLIKKVKDCVFPLMELGVGSCFFIVCKGDHRVNPNKKVNLMRSKLNYQLKSLGLTYTYSMRRLEVTETALKIGVWRTG